MAVSVLGKELETDGMRDGYYLLSLREVTEESSSAKELIRRAEGCVDDERRRRAAEAKSHKRRLEILGGGMLLQLAIRRVKEAEPAVAQAGRKGRQIDVVETWEFGTLLAQLERQKAPHPLAYRYGENAKPYLENAPYFFSISHSGEYVFLALSDQEVGADIQQCREPVPWKIAERFFSEEERCVLGSCASEGERKKMFYRLWVRKEAYTKLLGQSLSATLGQSMDRNEDSRYEFIEYVDDAGYCAAVCKSERYDSFL